MKITLDHIQALQTGNGGYNKKTLAMLKIKWPPKKGWKKKAIGMEINEAIYIDRLNANQLKRTNFKNRR